MNEESFAIQGSQDGQEEAGLATRDEERWAEALAIERIHGDRARVWVAERALELAQAGDVSGAERMLEISMRLKLLRNDDRPYLQ